MISATMRANRRIAHGVLSALTGALLFASGATATAGEVTYPATMCQQWDGPPLQVNFSRLQNNSAVPAQVDCPILKQPGKGTTYTQVFALDRNLSQNVVCRTFSYRNFDPGQRPDRVGAARSTTGDGSTSQVIRMDGMQPHASGGSQWAISCTIPPNDGPGRSSALEGYHVAEP